MKALSLAVLMLIAGQCFAADQYGDLDQKIKDSLPARAEARTQARAGLDSERAANQAKWEEQKKEWATRIATAQGSLDTLQAIVDRLNNKPGAGVASEDETKNAAQFRSAALEAEAGVNALKAQEIKARDALLLATATKAQRLTDEEAADGNWQNQVQDLKAQFVDLKWNDEFQNLAGKGLDISWRLLALERRGDQLIAGAYIREKLASLMSSKAFCKAESACRESNGNTPLDRKAAQDALDNVFYSNEGQRGRNPAGTKTHN